MASKDFHNLLATYFQVRFLPLALGSRGDEEGGEGDRGLKGPEGQPG